MICVNDVQRAIGFDVSAVVVEFQSDRVSSWSGCDEA